jgi:uncharacterized protein YyaL (SSP411 family)
MTTNRLQSEKSPYLLQHAQDPVDWYPWSGEALERARLEDRPIFLSIGYAACHWCHVMGRESFRDGEVADLLNRYYVPVKVDREERPDLDQIYMTACQTLTGHGGWPLTVILDPRQRPFFAGTYFPPRTRGGRPGLIEVLTRLADLWRTDRDRLLRSGQQLAEVVRDSLIAASPGTPGDEPLHQAYRQLVMTFDGDHGGFGPPPKFPNPAPLGFLLRHYSLTGEPLALTMVDKTLRAMRRGGMWDHVGFGFARYSTDRSWLVPHFEKMLYDQALLAIAYLEAYQVTGNPHHAEVARDIFEYGRRELTHPGGGFYTAEDADSEGKEGEYYLWTPAEIRQVLGEDLGNRYCRRFGVTEAGNFRGKSIPNRLGRVGAPAGDGEAELPDDARIRLLETRSRRPRPLLDDKILTAGNALMAAALARGSRVLGRAEYARSAGRALAFIESHLVREDGRLLARYRERQAAFPGYLDDYAFLVWAYLELFEAEGEPAPLEAALRWNQAMVELFADEERGGFFFSGRDGEELIARPRTMVDGPMPAGNAVAALNLLRLAALTDDADLSALADRQLTAFAGQAQEAPGLSHHFLTALQFRLTPTITVVVAGPEDHPDTRLLLEAGRESWLPFGFVLYAGDGQTGARLERTVPLLRDRIQPGRPSTAYLCRGNTCREPITDPEVLRSAIRASSLPNAKANPKAE